MTDRLDKLRRRAEEALAKGRIDLPSRLSPEAAADTQALIEDLRIYQAELELQNEELKETRQRTEVLLSRYATLFDSLPIPALVADPHGLVTQANAEAAVVFGARFAQFLGQHSLGRLVEPRDRNRLSQAFARLETETTRTMVEVQLRGQQGPIPAEVHLAALPSTFEAARHTLAMFVDRSDAAALHQREVELSASEARFHIMSDWAVDWEYWISPDSRFVYMTPSAEEVTGYSPEDFTADPDLLNTIVHPEDRPRWQQHLRHHLAPPARKAPSRDSEIQLRILTKAGETRWIDHRCRPIFDPHDGQYRGQRVTMRDITEHKQLETALQDAHDHLEQRVVERTRALEEATHQIELAELKYRTVADHTYDWECWIGTDGHYLYSSPSCTRLTGHPPADFLRDPELILHLLHPDDRARVAPHIAGHVQPDGAHTLEFRICHRSGGVRWIEHICQPVYDVQGHFIGRRASNRDITERKRAEAVIEANRVAAEAASHAKSLFLANMSHELRTPLNAILGFSDLLRRDPAMAENHRRELAIIGRAGRHLQTLIDDVLEISRIEAGRSELHLEAFDLDELLNAVEEMIRLRAVEKGLELQVERQGPSSTYVTGDARRLRQVLLNLLGNAVKYTDSGRVRLSVQCEREQWHFVVEDTGPGIQQADRHRIFDAFYQTETGAARGEGAGLGLAIANEFVRLMGGCLEVCGLPGQGTAFAFSLPLPPAEVPAAVSPSRPVIGLAPGHPEVRVLVADDLEDHRLLLTRWLEGAGFTVGVAADGTQAVAQFTAFKPHFLWIDMRMPILDGYTATRQIRALPGGDRVRIAALTANAFREDREAIFAAGCDALLTKPVCAADLFAVMEPLLDLQFRHAEDELPEESAPAATPDLTTLETETLTALHAAAVRLDLHAIQNLIESLRPQHAHLAGALRRLAERFRFDSIATLCEEAMG